MDGEVKIMSARRILTTICAASALALAAGMASAATVTLTNISAEWSNAIDGPNGSNPVYSATGDNPATLRWGTASDPNKRSGYDFLAESTPIAGLEEEELFLLGQFTHLNYTINSGTGIKGADLDLTFEFVLDLATDPSQTTRVLTSTFHFTHNETPNSTPCEYPGSVTVCDDGVHVETVSGGTTSFEINGVKFHFGVEGFMDEEMNLVNPFITPESAATGAGLYAKFTSEPIAPVPLPAGGLLLLGGLAGLGVLRRRRKAA